MDSWSLEIWLDHSGGEWASSQSQLLGRNDRGINRRRSVMTDRCADVPSAKRRGRAGPPIAAPFMPRAVLHDEGAPTFSMDHGGGKRREVMEEYPIGRGPRHKPGAFSCSLKLRTQCGHKIASAHYMFLRFYIMPRFYWC